MEVDEALGKLGTMGKWQILYYSMIGTACMVPACLHMLAINYLGEQMRYSINYQFVCNYYYNYWIN